MHWQLIAVGSPFSCRWVLHYCTEFPRKDRPDSIAEISWCFSLNWTVNRDYFFISVRRLGSTWREYPERIFTLVIFPVYMWQHGTHAQAKVTGQTRRHNQIHISCACIFSSFIFGYLRNRCVRESDNTKRGWYISETHIQFFFLLFIREREKKNWKYQSENIVCGAWTSHWIYVREEWRRAVKVMPGKHGRNPDEPNCKFFVEIFFPILDSVGQFWLRYVFRRMVKWCVRVKVCVRVRACRTPLIIIFQFG